MKAKEHFYAVIGGCIGAVLTLVVCSLSPLGAQSQSDADFGKITCTEIDVVGPDGTLGVWISGGRKHGGLIHVYDKDGISEAFMFIGKHGGSVGVYGKDGKSSANMGVDENGGVVNVQGKSTEFLSLNFKREKVIVDK